MIMKTKLMQLFFCSLVFLTAPVFSQITAGRGIMIRIQGVPDTEKSRIDGQYSVSTGGTVRMPMVEGEVQLAGLSTNNAAAKLESIYKSKGIYTNPTFQIIASSDAEVVQNMITIGGFVRAPGPKPFTLGMTLYAAVQAAGGANEFGNIRKVLLMRGINSKQYDLNNLKDRVIVLQPNDTIEIPEKGIFR
jgi:polysaccharide biosynthesis/export protein VpsN